MLNLPAFNVITQLGHNVSDRLPTSEKKQGTSWNSGDSLKDPTDDLTSFALSPSFPSIRLKMQPERGKKTVRFNKTTEIDFFLLVSLPSWVPLKA